MINSVKDLQKLIALCQRTGVESVKIGDLELKLGPTPLKPIKRPSTSQWQPRNIDQILTDSPTEEQLMFGSSDPSVWVNNKDNQ